MSDPIIRIVVEDVSPPAPGSQQSSQPTSGSAPPIASGVPAGGPSPASPSRPPSNRDRQPESIPAFRPPSRHSSEQVIEIENRIGMLVESFLKPTLRYSFPGGIAGVQTLAGAFPKVSEGLAAGAEGLAGRLGGKGFGEEFGNALRHLMGIEEQISTNVAKIVHWESSTAPPPIRGQQGGQTGGSVDPFAAAQSGKEQPAMPHLSQFDAALGDRASTGQQSNRNDLPIANNAVKAFSDAEKGAASGAKATKGVEVGLSEAVAGTAATAVEGTAIAAGAAEGGMAAGTMAAGSAAGPVGLATAAGVILLGDAALGAAGAVKTLEKYFLQTAQELSQFSPDITVAQSRAEIRHMQGDINEAQTLGPALSRLVEAQSEMDEAIREIWLPIKEVLVTVLADLLELVRDGVVAIKDVIGWLVRFWNWLRWKDEEEKKEEKYDDLMDSFFSIGEPFASHPPAAFAGAGRGAPSLRPRDTSSAGVGGSF